MGDLIHGNELVLLLDEEPMAVATSVEVELTSTVKEVDVLPGSVSDEDAEWATFVRDRSGWAVSHDGFVADFDLLRLISGGDVLWDILVTMPGMEISGEGYLSEVSLIGDVQQKAKISAKLTCENMPSINYIDDLEL